MTEHLRINGVYWGLVALCLMNRPEALDRDDMIKYVLSCWDKEAGKQIATQFGEVWLNIP
jgi:geranylgeranyl transferase type-2 subunit beta